MMMATWKAVDPDIAHRLFSRLRALNWQWKASQAHQAAEQLGWTITAEDPDAGAMADAALALGGHEAMLAYRADTVDQVKVDLTENTGPVTREPRAFLQDRFADLTGIATQLYGQPTRRTHGELAEVQWRDDSTTLSINRSIATIILMVMPNAHQDRWDEMEPAST